MATMYCALCDRPVEARREIGAGTVVFAVLTAGLSLLAIPLYRRRCAICKSTAVHRVYPSSIASPLDPDVQAELDRLDAELAKPYVPRRTP